MQFRSVSERHCETKLIWELETTSNCKRIETLAVFPDNSDIVIVNTHLPPFPLINVVMDLVMIFKVTSNNIERGRVFKSVFSVGNPRIALLLLLFLLLLLLLLLLEENVSTILQLLVWARYLYRALVLNVLYEPKLVCITSVVNHLKIPVFHLTVVACLTMANEKRVFLAFSEWRNWL